MFVTRAAKSPFNSGLAATVNQPPTVLKWGRKMPLSNRDLWSCKLGLLLVKGMWCCAWVWKVFGPSTRIISKIQVDQMGSGQMAYARKCTFKAISLHITKGEVCCCVLAVSFTLTKHISPKRNNWAQNCCVRVTDLGNWTTSPTLVPYIFY